jgi:glutamate racemase
MHHKIREYTPADIKILSQREIVSNSLVDYLSRHPEIEKKLSLGGSHHFYTTDSAEDFDKHAAHFYGAEIRSVHVDLEAQKL